MSELFEAGAGRAFSFQPHFDLKGDAKRASRKHIKTILR